MSSHVPEPTAYGGILMLVMMVDHSPRASRPNAPPGCQRAYCSRVRPLCLSSAIDSEQSTYIFARMLTRGTRFNEPPSFSTPASNSTSDKRASSELQSPDTPMILMSSSRSVSTADKSSGVVPLLEIAIAMSLGQTWPAEPWMHSVACRKYAGVPVLERRDAT